MYNQNRKNEGVKRNKVMSEYKSEYNLFIWIINQLGRISLLITYKLSKLKTYLYLKLLGPNGNTRSKDHMK